MPEPYRPRTRPLDRRNGKHLPCVFEVVVSALLDGRLDILFGNMMPQGAPPPSEIVNEALLDVEWEYTEQAGDFVDYPYFTDMDGDPEPPEPSNPYLGQYLDSPGKSARTGKRELNGTTVADVFNLVNDGLGTDFHLKARFKRRHFTLLARIFGVECLPGDASRKLSPEDAEIVDTSAFFGMCRKDSDGPVPKKVRDRIERLAPRLGFEFIDGNAVEKLKEDIRNNALGALRKFDTEKLLEIQSNCGPLFADALLAGDGEQRCGTYDDDMLCAMLCAVYDIGRDKFDGESELYYAASVLAEEKLRRTGTEEKVARSGGEPVEKYEMAAMRRMLLSLPAEEFEARWNAAYEYTREKWRRALGEACANAKR